MLDIVRKLSPKKLLMNWMGGWEKRKAGGKTPRLLARATRGVWFLYIEMGKVAMGESLGSGAGAAGQDCGLDKSLASGFGKLIGQVNEEIK